MQCPSKLVEHFGHWPAHIDSFILVNTFDYVYLSGGEKLSIHLEYMFVTSTIETTLCPHK